jgi:flagellar P-ring protein FlgI
MTKYLLCFLLTACCLSQAAVRLKSIAHLSGLQDNPLSGYGLVIGLAGSGDSRRNKDTTQAVANLLQSFGVTISPHEVNSRNTATVIITANLPSYAHQGDKLDINVASLGDAKSLLGGTLLMTPLKGPDNEVYALAQGPISIGGFSYDSLGNVLQKNHPTAGLIPSGAVVEKTLYNELASKKGDLHIILNHPDFTTADHVERAVNHYFKAPLAEAKSAQDIVIHPPLAARKHLIHFISQLETIALIPDHLPLVVVNERTGVVIAGTQIKINAVTIAQGNLQVVITKDYKVSQPTLVASSSDSLGTAITPAIHLKTAEEQTRLLRLPEGTTLATLISALTKVKTSTRDLIAILESLQRAGALQAELIIQ